MLSSPPLDDDSENRPEADESESGEESDEVDADEELPVSSR